MTGSELIAIARSLDPLVEFADPATEPALTDAEARLGVRLPTELRGFLHLADGATLGVRLSSGHVAKRASPLVWSISEIVTENDGFPSPLGGVADVLFFANAGVDGILFGHRLVGATLEDQVVGWHPIEGTLDPLTPTFGDYLQGWLRGTLTV